MKNKLLCGLRMSLIVVGVCVCLAGCGDEKKDNSTAATSSETVNEATNTSLDNAKEAYALLSSSADTVDLIGHGIVGAWGYAIDHSTNYDGTISGLASYCGLTSGEVQATYDEFCKTLGSLGTSGLYKPGTWISDFSDVVNGLITYGYAPYIEKIEENLASAKTLIQTVDQSEPYYSDLVNYYTAISNYLEFCKSPTGNYQSVGTTINEYNTEMSTSKSKLSFYLE